MATKKKATKKTTTSRSSVRQSSVDTIPQPPVETAHSNKRFMIPVGVLLVLAALYLARGVFVAATVNGQPISRLSVVQQLEKQGGKQTLDNLVTRVAIQQEGKKKNITISQKEMDEQLKKIEKNLTGQGMTLDQALQAQGMTKSALLEELKLQLTVQKLAGSNVAVTDKDVDAYIEQNKALLEQSPEQEINRTQIKDQLTQQKQQEKTQKYVEDLRKKAKVAYYTSY